MVKILVVNDDSQVLKKAIELAHSKSAVEAEPEPLNDGLWQKPKKATLKGATFAHQNPELFEEHYNSRPLACPNCKGTGKASKPPCTVGGHCLNCKGAGVVWR